MAVDEPNNGKVPGQGGPTSYVKAGSKYLKYLIPVIFIGGGALLFYYFAG